MLASLAVIEAAAQARGFERIRARLLDRLLEVRASFDPGLARVDETRARAELAALVSQLGAFLVSGDLGLHAGFVRSTLARRGREAGGAAAVVSTLVAVGDLAARVAVEQLGDDGQALAVALTARTAATVRVCSDLLAEELGRRVAQRDAMGWGPS